MNPQPDIALARLGIMGRLSSLADLVQIGRSAPLMLTAVIGHAVNFLSLPIVLRIYGPEAFGEYSLVVSIAYVLLVAATLKLEVVIPTMRRVSLAARLTSALFMLSILVGLAVFPAGMLLYSLTGWQPGHAMPFVSDYAVTAALVCLFGTFLVMRNWLVRLKALSGVAVMQLVRPLGFVALAIIFGYLWPEDAPTNGLALLLATAIALLGAIILGFLSIPRRFYRFVMPTRWRRSWQEVRANKRYLSAVSVSQVLDLLSLQIPLWITAGLYGATPAGWVALATRIVFLPAIVAGASLGPVLNRQVSTDYYERRQLAQKVTNYLMMLGIAGLAGFGLIALLADWLTDVVFGGKWIGAAPTLRIYCFYGFAYFLSNTIGFIPILLQEKRYLVLMNATRLAGLFLAALAAHVSDASFESFIALLAGVEVCTYFFSVAYTVHIMHRHDTVVRQPAV